MFSFFHTFTFYPLDFTLHSEVMRREQHPACHQRLRGPHGHDRLCVPDRPPILRAFLSKAMEQVDFQGASSEREQVHLLRKWGAQLEKGISMQQIADFMQIEKSTVQYHLSRPYDVIDGCVLCRLGRPALLSAEQEEVAVRFVERCFMCRTPPSYEEFRTYLYEKFGLVVDLESLYQYIGNNERLRTVTGIPMEDARVFARTSEIDQYLKRIQEIITIGEIPSAFVVNIDESGFETYVVVCILRSSIALEQLPAYNP